MMMNQMRPQRGARRDPAPQSPGEDRRRPGPAVSLAMVYPVDQPFEDLYTPDEALCAGTLFKALEKPFHRGFRL